MEPQQIDVPVSLLFIQTVDCKSSKAQFYSNMHCCKLSLLLTAQQHSVITIRFSINFIEYSSRQLQ